MRVIGRRDDMFIVRGVNVYPSAILAVVGQFRPRVTGRARVIRNTADVSIMPPVPIEVEVKEKDGGDARLKADIEDAIHRTLIFRAKVDLIPEESFGESGYKTRLTVNRT
jgi:phenylacetate-CoA ligase